MRRTTLPRGTRCYILGPNCRLFCWPAQSRVVSLLRRHWSLPVSSNLLVVMITMVTFVTPRGMAPFTGGRFEITALRGSLASRDLWIYGVALLGGYGAYFTTSQLFAGYAAQDRHLSASSGGLLSALILLAGIPAACLAATGPIAVETREPSSWVRC